MTDSGTISPMPAPSIAVPAQGEDMFPVRFKEWARLREKVSALKKKRRQWANFGWALIGIGTSAALSWLPYFAKDDAGGTVAVMTACVAAAGLVGGSIALLAAKDTAMSIENAVQEIRVHMHDMESNLTQEQRRQVNTFAKVILDE